MSARDRIITALSSKSRPSRVPALHDVADAEQLADAHRTEVLTEVTMWLVKKAREFRAIGTRKSEAQANTLDAMASKIARGAVRPDNLRMLDPEFFEVDHSYTHRNGNTFRCVAVTTHPDSGERVAIGWHTDTAGWTFVDVRNINHWNHEYDGVKPPAEDGEGR